MTGRRRHQHTRRIFKARRRRSRRWRTVAVWAVGGAVLVAAALLFDMALRQVHHPRMDANDVALVDAGRRIYAQACSSCHGVSLQGQPNWPTRSADGRMPGPPLDGSGHAWQLRDKDLFEITKEGPAAYPPGHSREMPAFGQQLSDKEIASILAYVKSVWPPDLQVKQARRNMEFWTKIAH